MIIDELITALENAGEGDRELDYEIHVFLGWQDNDECGWSRGFKRTGSGWPYYTTSLDAALTLVPADFFVELRRHSDGWYAFVAPHSQTRRELGFSGDQKPAPLAVCIAALKARAFRP